MNRGTFILISKDTKTNPLNPEYHIYKSQEFNGSMGLDSLGKNGYLELKNKVNSAQDFYNFVKNFNDKYFQYDTKEFPICYETKDSKAHPFIDDKGEKWYEFEEKGNTFDLFKNPYPKSDNYYIKYISTDDEPIKIACKNGLFTLKPNQILVSDFDECINNTGISFGKYVHELLEELQDGQNIPSNKETQKEDMYSSPNIRLVIASKYSVLVDRFEEVEKEINELKEMDREKFPKFINGDDLIDVIDDMKDVLTDRCNEVYNEKSSQESDEEEM